MAFPTSEDALSEEVDQNAPEVHEGSLPGVFGVSSKSTASAGLQKASVPALSRRSFAVGAIGACAMLGLGGAKYLPSKPVCRPPGGQDETHLIATCVRCEKCREVCPKTVISPAYIEDGILNARTPKLNFKRGWCDFCEKVEGGPRCIAVCPTQALATSCIATAILGKAVLNVDWCLAAKSMGCRECVDACNYEALALGEDGVPVVDEDACNGCGACEYVCISLSSGSITAGASDRAIVVKPLEEMVS